MQYGYDRGVAHVQCPSLERVTKILGGFSNSTNGYLHPLCGCHHQQSGLKPLIIKTSANRSLIKPERSTLELNHDKFDNDK